MKKIIKTIRKAIFVSVILSILVMLVGLPSIAFAQNIRADFNGDGFDDLAIGVPGEDVGSITDAGAVNVIYGTSGGLSAANDQFFTQNTTNIEDTAEASDNFGSALTSGDFNGDGFDDLAIGVPNEDVGSINQAGAVNVIYGRSGGLTVFNDQFFTQDTTNIEDTPENNDLFGATLASGDFNGDGFDDLAIGVHGEDVGVGIVNAGAVNVIYSGSGGLSAISDQFFTQDTIDIEDTAEANDFFGRALLAGAEGVLGYSGAWIELAQTCEGSGADIMCTIEGVLEVENPGTVTAEEAVLQFFLSSDKILDDNDTLLEETLVGPVEPQEMVEVNLLEELPAGQDAIGQFVIAFLDATDVVLEANEENNIVVSNAIGEGGNGGGCATLAGPIKVGTTTANLLILLIPAFAIGLRALMRRRNNTNSTG